MTRALITGDQGFVGPYLRALLETEGIEVYGFDLKAGGDIRDYETLRLAIDTIGPDLIFHLAAQAFVPEATMNPARAIDVNVNGTLNLLEAVRNTGHRPRILLAGTSEEYGYDTTETLDELSTCAPTTPYGVSKLAASTLGLVYARTYGMDVVATRAFNHTGPKHQPVYAIPSFAKRVATTMAWYERVGPGAPSVSPPIVLHGNLEAFRNYTDVRDVVRAYRLAIDAPSGIYNVCSDRTVSLQWVLDYLIEQSDVDVPTGLDRGLSRGIPSSKFPEARSDKLRAVGWEPEISLEQTLTDTLAYWKEELCR